jgi:tetratricopeptide (TPR) repeat protein
MGRVRWGGSYGSRIRSPAPELLVPTGTVCLCSAMTCFSPRRNFQAAAVLVGMLFLWAVLGMPSRAQTSSVRAVDSLRTAGRFQAALERLSDLPQTRSRSVGMLWRRSILWSDYGLSRLRSGDDQGAQSAFQKSRAWAGKALAADSNSARAHLAKAVAAGRTIILADSRRKKIRLSRAVKRHADRAVELDPTLAPAYHVRGVWHGGVAELGVFARAIVRVVYGGLPEASLEQAVADLKRAISAEPRAASYLELGKVYQKMGRTEAARKQFRAALDTAPTSPFAPVAKRKARKRLRGLG